MRATLEVGNTMQLPKDLQEKLAEIEANESLMIEIGARLQQSHMRRLYLQRDIDGQPWQPRRVWRWNGQRKAKKMLQGMRKLQIVTNTTAVAIGYTNHRNRAALARWHNEGKVGADGFTRPRREWFGIGAVDRRAIDRIITKHLSSR